MQIVKLRWFKPIVWIIELAVIASLFGSIVTIAKKKDVVGERAAALSRMEAENARLRRQLVQAQSTSFVEKEARDKLGLVKPGEVVVLVGKGASSASGLLSPGEASLPRWQQWWQLFF